MTKQPLEKLFNAMYHGKASFEDFLQSSTEQNYDRTDPADTGNRTLFKPKENLKTYHKFLNLFLFELLPINERVVFSYRKGFSAINAVEKHRHSKYFFQTDIKSFFDSIDRSLTKRTILAGSDFCPIEDLEEHIDRIVDLVCVDDAVPVGLPASAPLSNAVLFNFDNELEIICNSLDLHYSRYADDIIISGQVQENLSQIEQIAQQTLHRFASEKFFLHYGKTRFFQVGSKIKILGMMILPNGKISVDTKKKKDLEVLLHFYLNDRSRFNKMVVELKSRPGETVEMNEDDYIAFLSGNINYVDSIDPDYTDKLRRKFGTTTIDVLKHSGFSKEK